MSWWNRSPFFHCYRQDFQENYLNGCVSNSLYDHITVKVSEIVKQPVYYFYIVFSLVILQKALHYKYKWNIRVEPVVIHRLNEIRSFMRCLIWGPSKILALFFLYLFQAFFTIKAKPSFLSFLKTLYNIIIWKTWWDYTCSDMCFLIDSSTISTHNVQKQSSFYNTSYVCKR